jgi:2-dehydro-3-deoxyphosphogluconate aldolase/(4S)-4-hydroxy-2-oxoglutarate aldolase
MSVIAKRCDMHVVLEALGRIGVVPVIKIDDAEKAAPLARALVAGGIPCAEVTFRTAAGEEAIRRMRAEVPEILVGAGTVLSVEQVDRAVAAGAAFIVSPGLNPRVVSHCVQKGVPITPGCSSPSDIERALEAGLDVVKFFPAVQAGGLEYIKAVAAPYASMMFIPTGGINAGNIAEYTACERVLACGGSWMVGADLINAGGFWAITALCREAVLNMLDFRFAHIGVNAGSEAAAEKAAKLFETLFGMKRDERGASIFAGSGIEIMKNAGPGSRGHIGIKTSNAAKAAAYLERMGIELDSGTARLDKAGNITFVYLKEEIAGFAVHLVQ